MQVGLELTQCVFNALIILLPAVTACVSLRSCGSNDTVLGGEVRELRAFWWEKLVPENHGESRPRRWGRETGRAGSSATSWHRLFPHEAAEARGDAKCQRHHGFCMALLAWLLLYAREFCNRVSPSVSIAPSICSDCAFVCWSSWEVLESSW